MSDTKTATTTTGATPDPKAVTAQPAGAKPSAEPAAKPSATSTSGTPDTKGATPSTQKGSQKPKDPLEIAAAAERAAAKKSEEADRRLAEAKKKEEDADKKLALAAKAALADEHMSKGDKLAAVKALLADSYNPAEFMELVARDFTPAEEEENDKEMPLDERIKKVVAESDKEKEAKAAATKEEERKKKEEEDAKKANEDREQTIKEWRTEVDKELNAEAFPFLAKKLEELTEIMGEEKARKFIQDKSIETYFNVYRDTKEEAEAIETLRILEVELKAKKAPPKDDIDAELERIDRENEEREKEAEKGRSSEMRRSTVATPSKKKAREEMTIMELAELEADEMDRRRSEKKDSRTLW